MKRVVIKYILFFCSFVFISNTCFALDRAEDSQMSMITNDESSCEIDILSTILSTNNLNDITDVTQFDFNAKELELILELKSYKSNLGELEGQVKVINDLAAEIDIVKVGNVSLSSIDGADCSLKSNYQFSCKHDPKKKLKGKKLSVTAKIDPYEMYNYKFVKKVDSKEIDIDFGKNKYSVTLTSKAVKVVDNKIKVIKIIPGLIYNNGKKTIKLAVDQLKDHGMFKWKLPSGISCKQKDIFYLCDLNTVKSKKGELLFTALFEAIISPADISGGELKINLSDLKKPLIETPKLANDGLTITCVVSPFVDKKIKWSCGDQFSECQSTEGRIFNLTKKMKWKGVTLTPQMIVNGKVVKGQSITVSPVDSLSLEEVIMEDDEGDDITDEIKILPTLRFKGKEFVGKDILDQGSIKWSCNGGECAGEVKDGVLFVKKESVKSVKEDSDAEDDDDADEEKSKDKKNGKAKKEEETKVKGDKKSKKKKEGDGKEGKKQSPKQVSEKAVGPNYSDELKKSKEKAAVIEKELKAIRDKLSKTASSLSDMAEDIINLKEMDSKFLELSRKSKIIGEYNKMKERIRKKNEEIELTEAAIAKAKREIDKQNKSIASYNVDSGKIEGKIAQVEYVKKLLNKEIDEHKVKIKALHEELNQLESSRVKYKKDKIDSDQALKLLLQYLEDPKVNKTRERERELLESQKRYVEEQKKSKKLAQDLKLKIKNLEQKVADQKKEQKLDEESSIEEETIKIYATFTSGGSTIRSEVIEVTEDSFQEGDDEESEEVEEDVEEVDDIGDEVEIENELPILNDREKKVIFNKLKPIPPKTSPMPALHGNVRK